MSLEYLTSKPLRVLSQQMGLDTSPLPYALSIFQEKEHRENFSRHLNKVKYQIVESNTLSPEMNCWWKYYIVMQH